MAVSAAFLAACGGKVYDDHTVGAKGARDAGYVEPQRDAAVVADCSVPMGAGASAYAYFYEDFTGNGKLYGLHDGSSSPVQLLRVNAPRVLAGALAFDAAHVYYASQQADAIHDFDVFALSPGGAAGPRTLSTGLSIVRQLAVDETTLYVVETASEDPPIMRIGRISFSGACPTPGEYRTLVEIPDVQTTAIAAHGGYLYWNELSGIAARGSFGVVKRLPTTGGNAETLAANLAYPGALVADETGVYWLDFGNQGVSNCLTNGDLEYIPSAGQTPVTLASNLTNAVSLAVDQGSVYVGLFGSDCPTNPSGAGSIVRVSVASHEATTLITGVSRPVSLHVHGTNLYFLHFDPESKTQVPRVFAL